MKYFVLVWYKYTYLLRIYPNDYAHSSRITVFGVLRYGWVYPYPARLPHWHWSPSPMWQPQITRVSRLPEPPQHDINKIKQINWTGSSLVDVTDIKQFWCFANWAVCKFVIYAVYCQLDWGRSLRMWLGIVIFYVHCIVHDKKHFPQWPATVILRTMPRWNMNAILPCM